jgi:hypothetical protein
MFWLNSRDEDAAGVGDVWTVLRGMLLDELCHLGSVTTPREFNDVLTCTTIQFGAAFSVTMCRSKSLMCCSEEQPQS